jgi:hypothetical protein
MGNYKCGSEMHFIGRRNVWRTSLMRCVVLDTLTPDLQTDFLSCFVTCESNVESYATTMCYVLISSMVYTRRA